MRLDSKNEIVRVHVSFDSSGAKHSPEGYQMVLTEGVKAIDAGQIDIQIGSYYYFQHRNFIK